MNVQFDKLILFCRESVEEVNLKHQITYIHGKISAGKSSIVRLIDYCLGGKLEKTPAISQELVSVQLFASIGEYSVVFERDVEVKTLIQITWKNSENQGATVNAPLQARDTPIYGDDLYNFSDIMFHLLNTRPMLVRKNKYDENSKLIRLSFRDLIWYCYLDQDGLDSSFFNLQEPIKMTKSRDAMRFVTGFYTERLNQLEIEKNDLHNLRISKIESAKQMRSFLSEFGFSYQNELNNELEQINTEIVNLKNKIKINKENHFSETHFADTLREKLRKYNAVLDNEKIVLNDIKERIAEQESLRAELLSSIFKLQKVEVGQNIFPNIKFKTCPSCGSIIKHESTNENICHLCKTIKKIETEDKLFVSPLIQNDINSRIHDLDESLIKHKLALKQQENVVYKTKRMKQQLDYELTEILEFYDSSYLSSSLEIEKRISKLQERKESLNHIFNMLEHITKMENESSDLLSQIEKIERDMKQEKTKLKESELYVKEIGDEYMNTLQKVGVPGINISDKVIIDLRTWIPKIIPQDGEPYSFYNAGSGGKKTLLSVCYAIAIHIVAEKYKFPLPNFLIIDTPMKNIGEDVNIEIFNSFYNYLYDLSLYQLSNTQIIVIDKEYFTPENSQVDIYNRYMTPDNPLISYYKGP